MIYLFESDFSISLKTVQVKPGPAPWERDEGQASLESFCWGTVLIRVTPLFVRGIKLASLLSKVSRASRESKYVFVSLLRKDIVKNLPKNMWGYE